MKNSLVLKLAQPGGLLLLLLLSSVSELGSLTVILDNVYCVWKCYQMLSKVFDLSSQSKLELRREQRSVNHPKLC